MISLLFALLRLGRAISLGLRDPAFRGLFFLTLTLLVVGTTFYHFVEGWRVLDALYFSVITLATVGYGDLTPQTDIGKLFTMLYIILGLGVLVAFLQAIATHLLQDLAARPVRGAPSPLACPPRRRHPPPQRLKQATKGSAARDTYRRNPAPSAIPLLYPPRRR